jgi:NAD-dependent SIR2 family protein deacetylase
MMAEARKETEQKAKADLAAEKAINHYHEILKKEANTIAKLTAKNKELKQIRDIMFIKKNDNSPNDAHLIAELNAEIERNTNLITLNLDAAGKQKANIGKYTSAFEGLKVQISETEAALRVLDVQGKFRV